MRMVGRIFSAAFALALTGLSLATARAETINIYDGLTFDQFKEILSKTNLGLKEEVTDKGNRFFIIAVEGASTPFIGGMTNCADRDGKKVCDGFMFLHIDEKNRLTADAMAKFNNDYTFLKATPGLGDPVDLVISGEFFARGGITGMHVVFSAAYYTAVLESFLQRANGAIAMNGRGTRWATVSASRQQADRFFSEFTMPGGRKARPLGAYKPAIDEALIDALAARQ